MQPQRISFLPSIGILLLTAILLGSCSTSEGTQRPAGGFQGETYPFVKSGAFGKDHSFWVFGISDITVTNAHHIGIRTGETRYEKITRAFALVLDDPAGFEWEITALTWLTSIRESRKPKEKKIVDSYTLSARMKEENLERTLHVRADYVPGNPGFKGSLTGTVSDASNQEIYTFESNQNIDSNKKPDKGLLVFSIAMNGTTVAVLDSRHGYEVTFYEGLLPTQRTEIASLASCLFTLLRYARF